MATLGSLLVRLGVKSQLQSGFRTARKDISGFQRSTRKSSKGIKASFAAMGAAALSSLAIGSVVRSAVNTISSFEQATADLAAVSGKTTAQLKNLVQSAKDIGARSSFSASEVVGLQKELAKLGFTEREILKSAEAVGQFSVAVGTDAASAAAVGGAALRSFGIDASESRETLATLAVATTKSALDFEKLSTALPFVGTVAKEAGISLERTTAILGLLADRGLQASTSGTSLRSILLDVAKSGQDLNIVLDKVSNSDNKLATATELFGKKAAAAAVIIADNRDQLDELEKSITGVSSSLDEMTNTRLDTLEGKLTLTKSAWEGFILSIDTGDGIISKTFKNAATSLTSFIGKLTKLNDGELSLGGLLSSFNFLTPGGAARATVIQAAIIELDNFKKKAASLNLSGILAPKAVKQLEGIYTRLGLDDAKQKAFDFIQLIKEQNALNDIAVKTEKKKGDTITTNTISIKDQISALSKAVIGGKGNLIDDLVTATLKLRGQNSTLEKAANLVERIKATGGSDFSVSSFSSLPSLTPGNLTSNSSFKPSDLFDEMNEKVRQSREELEAWKAAQVDAMTAFIDFTPAITESFALLGTSLADLFTGDGNAANFFGGILNIVAGFTEQLGKQMLAIGAAGIALKTVFTNPFAALAAGGALIILSAAVRKFAAAGIPSLAVGTDLVNSDGLAFLHKGERVVPANVVSGGFNGGGNGTQRLYATISHRDIYLSNQIGQATSNRLR